MKELLLELQEFNQDCNLKLINHLLELGSKLPEKSLSLMNHIINSHQIWNARILDFNTHEVWQINPKEQWLKLAEDNYTHSIKIIKSVELSLPISYTNARGEQYTNKVTDILLHTVNHTTYHRAQIMTDLKNNDLKTIVTDYIAFKR